MNLPRGPSHPTAVLLVEEADFLLGDKRRPICDSPSPTSPVRHQGWRLEAKTPKQSRSQLPARGEPSPAHCSLTAGSFSLQRRVETGHKRLGRLLQPPQSLEAQPGLLGHLRALPGVHPQALWVSIWKEPWPGTLQTWSSPTLPPAALDSVQTTRLPRASVFSSVN